MYLLCSAHVTITIWLLIWHLIHCWVNFWHPASWQMQTVKGFKFNQTVSYTNKQCMNKFNGGLPRVFRYFCCHFFLPGSLCLYQWQASHVLDGFVYSGDVSPSTGVILSVSQWCSWVEEMGTGWDALKHSSVFVSIWKKWNCVCFSGILEVWEEINKGQNSILISLLECGIS